MVNMLCRGSVFYFLDPRNYAIANKRSDILESEKLNPKYFTMTITTVFVSSYLYSLIKRDLDILMGKTELCCLCFITSN